MPDSCQPFSAVDFNHTDCKKKVLLLGSRAHPVFRGILREKIVDGFPVNINICCLNSLFPDPVCYFCPPRASGRGPWSDCWTPTTSPSSLEPPVLHLARRRAFWASTRSQWPSSQGTQLSSDTSGVGQSQRLFFYVVLKCIKLCSVRNFRFCCSLNVCTFRTTELAIIEYGFSKAGVATDLRGRQI